MRGGGAQGHGKAGTEVEGAAQEGGIGHRMGHLGRSVSLLSAAAFGCGGGAGAAAKRVSIIRR